MKEISWQISTTNNNSEGVPENAKKKGRRQGKNEPDHEYWDNDGYVDLARRVEFVQSVSGGNRDRADLCTIFWVDAQK
jgi:hypothetical protein